MGTYARGYVSSITAALKGRDSCAFPGAYARPARVLVDVRAAGLNPVDFKFRQGKLRAIYRPKLPFVLGNELAGEIVAVGGEVSRFRVGDRVFARVGKEGAGAFAERACIDADLAALMPRNLDFTAAAAVPLAALTALQALRDELAIKPGQKVLISGGAGGVGTFAIQIAKWLRRPCDDDSFAARRGAGAVARRRRGDRLYGTGCRRGRQQVRCRIRPGRRQDARADVRDHEAGRQDRFSCWRSGAANRDQGPRRPLGPGGRFLDYQLPHQVAGAPCERRLSLSFHAPERQ